MSGLIKKKKLEENLTSKNNLKQSTRTSLLR